MKRFDIINHLIKKNNYKSYLEIGTQADECLKKVKCKYKVGVDPEPVEHDFKLSNKFFLRTSDDFFCKNKDTFDIIFIDGLHESTQVYKDVLNALEVLKKNGSIIIHDCNPIKKEHQTKAVKENDKWIIPHRATWNGDVWRAWLKLRATRKDLMMYVVDTDQGCGVIQRGKQKTLSKVGHNVVFFEDLDKNREKWLNLITIDKFLEL